MGGAIDDGSLYISSDWADIRHIIAVYFGASGWPLTNHVA